MHLQGEMCSIKYKDFIFNVSLFLVVYLNKINDIGDFFLLLFDGTHY